MKQSLGDLLLLDNADKLRKLCTRIHHYNTLSKEEYAVIYLDVGVSEATLFNIMQKLLTEDVLERPNDNEKVEEDPVRLLQRELEIRLSKMDWQWPYDRVQVMLTLMLVILALLIGYCVGRDNE